MKKENHMIISTDIQMLSAFSVILEVLASTIGYEKEIKGIHYNYRNKIEICLYRKPHPKNLQKTTTRFYTGTGNYTHTHTHRRASSDN